MPSLDRDQKFGVIRDAPFLDCIAWRRSISSCAAAGPVFNPFPTVASFAGFVARHGEERPPGPQESGQGK